MRSDRNFQRRRRVTAIDVAQAAGTSQSAVSRAFTANSSLSKDLKARILTAARELGYRPNAIARSLTTRRSRIIAVAMSYLNNQFYPDILERLSDRFQSADYQILLFTPDHSGLADPLFEQIMRYQVDAVVLASTSLSSCLAGECRKAGVPVVTLNRAIDDPDISSITGDNNQGGYEIGRFLAATNHKNLGFIAGIKQSSTNRDRERGFRQALQEVGLPVPHYALGNYSFDEAVHAARQMLSQQNRPDGIFCANDHMAIACMDVARYEFGLEIPKDLSIIGFDDVGAARWKAYDLTSYSQPIDAMVEAAFATVMALIEQPEQPARHLVVPGELVVRSSSRSLEQLSRKVGSGFRDNCSNQVGA